MSAVTPSRRGKRLLDLALLLPTIPLFVTVTAVLALAVLVADGRPIFFGQPRLGQGRRPFTIWKLRTMTTEADPRRRRPTRLGAILRQRGLDELPQLWCVLRGEMSLCGPRPLTEADAVRLAATCPAFEERFAALPGLTGLAQVCQAQGAAATAELDAAYAARRGVGLDLRILVRTAWMNVVGKRRGALRIELPMIRGRRVWSG